VIQGKYHEDATKHTKEREVWRDVIHAPLIFMRNVSLQKYLHLEEASSPLLG
jgi:hypothetical protein